MIMTWYYMMSLDGGTKNFLLSGLSVRASTKVKYMCDTYGSVKNVAPIILRFERSRTCAKLNSLTPVELCRYYERVVGCAERNVL